MELKKYFAPEAEIIEFQTEEGVLNTLFDSLGDNFVDFGE